MGISNNEYRMTKRVGCVLTHQLPHFDGGRLWRQAPKLHYTAVHFVPRHTQHSSLGPSEGTRQGHEQLSTVVHPRRDLLSHSGVTRTPSLSYLASRPTTLACGNQHRQVETAVLYRRDEEDLKRCVDYVHWNPRKHNLVRRVRDYPWSSFHRYVQMGEYGIDWGGTDPCPTWNHPD